MTLKEAYQEDQKQQAQQPQPIATDGNKSNQQLSMPKQEVQNLINRNLAAGNDPGKGVGRMMNQDKGAKPKKGQATDDGLEGTAPKGIKQYNDYGKIDYVQHSDSESHQNVSDRFDEANEKGLIPWNKQQESGSQGAGTDDYMDSFKSIMDMLDEDNTSSASTTPTYPAGPGYGYGYGYPGYYPSSLGDVTSMLEPYHMPTKEDLKKEKRNMAIRALGDGISAIAGMAGAINGGPNTVDATNSLTKTGRELIEKMREQRRKDYTAYLNAALKREQTNAANLRAMTQLERSREVSRRGRQTLALNVLDKINRWQNAKDANEIKDAHNKAIEAINKAKAEVEKQYKQGLISAKERQLTLDEYDNVTKRINANANMTRAQKAGSGGGKSGAGSNGEAKVTVTENTDRYGDTKTTTRISGTAEQVKKAQNQRGSGSDSSGGGRGNGGGKFENTKKLGL